MVRFPLPPPGQGRNEHVFHGLRCAREDAGCALPAATFRRPVGAKRGVARWRPRADWGFRMCGGKAWGWCAASDVGDVGGDVVGATGALGGLLGCAWWAEKCSLACRRGWSIGLRAVRDRKALPDGRATCVACRCRWDRRRCGGEVILGYSLRGTP